MDHDKELLLDTATRLGADAAEGIAFDGDRSNEEINEMALSMFVNRGGFRAFAAAGPVPRDDEARATLRTAFVDAFAARLRARLADASGNSANDIDEDADDPVARMARRLAAEALDDMQALVEAGQDRWSDFDDESIADYQDDAWTESAEPELRRDMGDGVASSRGRFRAIFVRIVSTAVETRAEHGDDPYLGDPERGPDRDE